MYAIPGGNSAVVSFNLEELIPTCSNRCGHGGCVCVVASLEGQRPSRVVTGHERSSIMH